MSSLIAITSQVNLNQEVYLNFSKENWDAQFLSQKFQNLTSSSPYERLPSLSFNHNKEFLSNGGLTSFETSSNFNYTKFERNNDFKGVSPNGSRLSAKQSIAVPFDKKSLVDEPNCAKVSTNFPAVIALEPQTELLVWLLAALACVPEPATVAQKTPVSADVCPFIVAESSPAQVIPKVLSI